MPSEADKVGKFVVGKRYIHETCLPLITEVERGLVSEAKKLAGSEADVANVIRISKDRCKIGLMDYGGFFEEAFPALRGSWQVDLISKKVSFRSYTKSKNPPILHRKELMLPPTDSRITEYQKLTAAAEQLGLFEDTARIGFKLQWEKMIADVGHEICEHQLVEKNQEQSTISATENEEAIEVKRHLTALSRNALSAPMQLLARHGYLNGNFSLFDYGCGQGDDLAFLERTGIKAAGWDPHYARTEKKQKADVVNLGFVINVIEDRDERGEALVGAYQLTKKVLIVAAMLVNDNVAEGAAYADGVVTGRGTFQKYYYQGELRHYITQVLGEEPVAGAPGIFLVFRDKGEEQRFLSKRVEFRPKIRSLNPEEIARRKEMRQKLRKDLTYEQHQEELDALWDLWVKLGRVPQKSEIENLIPLLEEFHSIGKAIRFLEDRFGLDEVEESRRQRIEDLTVYLALSCFERRKRYKRLEPNLQRDIKEFFGNYTSALEFAQEKLFDIADVEKIRTDCELAATNGIGYVLEGRALQLHSSLVQKLSPLLRIYVGAAATQYGDTEHAELVKIHIESGKVSFMRYDDFDSVLPRMLERVKVDMAEQGVRYYLYGKDYEPPCLYYKSRYMSGEDESIGMQLKFDHRLQALLESEEVYGPTPSALSEILRAYRLKVIGAEILRDNAPPHAESPCGKYLKFSTFSEKICLDCHDMEISNYVLSPCIVDGLLSIAERVLDRLIDYFGMINIEKVHISSEEGVQNIRLGVEFFIDDENVCEVLDWIQAECSKICRLEKTSTGNIIVW